MATRAAARPLRRHVGARGRAAALPDSYTTIGDTTKIRRAHFVQGKPIEQICRELKLSRKVVRKVLRSEDTAFEYKRSVQPLPKLGAWRGELDRLRHRQAPARQARFPHHREGSLFDADRGSRFSAG